MSPILLATLQARFEVCVIEMPNFTFFDVKPKKEVSAEEKESSVLVS